MLIRRLLANSQHQWVSPAAPPICCRPTLARQDITQSPEQNPTRIVTSPKDLSASERANLSNARPASAVNLRRDPVSAPPHIFCSCIGTAFLIRDHRAPVQVYQDRGLALFSVSYRMYFEPGERWPYCRRSFNLLGRQRYAARQVGGNVPHGAKAQRAILCAPDRRPTHSPSHGPIVRINPWNSRLWPPRQSRQRMPGRAQ